jgi:hypothetical protein
MNDELIGNDVLARTALGDQHLGQGGALLAGQQPADHIAAEHIEQHVEVIVRPLDRAQELGDVPAPDLIGSGGEQFGLRSDRTPSAGYGTSFFGMRSAACARSVEGGVVSPLLANIYLARLDRVLEAEG